VPTGGDHHKNRNIGPKYDNTRSKLCHALLTGHTYLIAGSVDTGMTETGPLHGSNKKSQQRRAAKAASATTKSQVGAANKAKRSYPTTTLLKACQIAQKIKELNGGNSWTSSDVAAALDMGAKSSNFFYLTAASRDFGLTIGTRDSDQIALAEMGREIVYAPSQK